MKVQEKDFNTYEFEGQPHLAIGEDYRYSATAILTHTLKLQSAKALAKKSWILTDDYQAEFKYKGHVFVLCTPLDSVDISPFDKNVPNEVTSELYDHIKSFKSVSLFSRIFTIAKSFFLPRNYEP